MFKRTSENRPPLSGLTSLTGLSIYNNSISDINALTGLTNLDFISLSSNNISDIKALVDNCNAGGLGSGNSVRLTTNPLSSQAIDVDIPYLQSKGVDIEY